MVSFVSLVPVWEWQLFLLLTCSGNILIPPPPTKQCISHCQCHFLLYFLTLAFLNTPVVPV